MNNIDIIFMFFGALLIFAGLYLFLSGKKDTSSNHVEGFGIKLNVSNPSIILILSGVGLLVLPRFMPENNNTLNNNDLNNDVLPPVVVNDSTYFPENSWNLTSYQENGVDFSVPYQVNATMTFSNRTATQTHWTTNVFVYDMNGNIINNSYNGKITNSSNGYTISFVGSTAIDFQPELNIPLEMKIENGGILHMSYTSRSGSEIAHWQQ